MAQDGAKIYISSTFSDLEEYREAVYDILRKARHDVVSMEDYVATDERPLDKCLEDVTDCDIYVGIFAWRYGYIPEKDNPEQQSITELEYRKAGEEEVPRLVFLLKKEAKWEPPLMDAISGDGDGGAKINAFREELGKAAVASFFSTPDELAGLASVAVSKAWERILEERCPSTKKPRSRKKAGVGLLINVPELPPHFFPRSEELQAIKVTVLADTNQAVAVTGTARRVGVQGMGGIGKTVLATAVARDEEVQKAFPDGVFWVTVGVEPLLTSLQSQLTEMLGDERQVFDNVQQGKSRLSELLAEQKSLLILDDVWQAEHAKAFEALGLQCQMLLTTRDASIITALGATEHRLDMLSREQALRFLAEWLGQSEDALPAQAQDVARECGNLGILQE